MKMNLNTTIIAIGMAAFLSACGGSGKKTSETEMSILLK